MEREQLLLHQAARCADACDALRAAVLADGVMADSSQGVRAHPALAELRQQQMTLARLLAALDIPAEGAGASDSRVGPPRGVYGIRGTA